MPLYTIDTAAAIKRLRDAKCDYALAEAIVSIVRETQEPLASKSDLDLMEAKLTGHVDSLETKLTGRMDGIEVKMDALDSNLSGRMDGIEVKMDALDKNLSGRMDGIEVKMDAHATKQNARSDGIEANMKSMENRMKIWILVAFVLVVGALQGIQYFLMNGL